MIVDANAAIDLPELEDPLCCLEMQQPYQGSQIPTIEQSDNYEDREIATTARSWELG